MLPPLRAAVLWMTAMALPWPGRCAPPASSPPADPFAAARARMVEAQIAARDVGDPRVLEAMRQVPRHLFVPPDLVRHAYEDRPLPIGNGQTISQPYIVALMTELARPAPTDTALEVGTGSGYQAAVIARLVSRLYTIELEETLAREAEARLTALGTANVIVRHGDGFLGWADQAPFDIILVTAAPERVPPALVDQLAPGGRMVIPLGAEFETQILTVLRKDASGRITADEILPVRFVPLRRRED